MASGIGPANGRPSKIIPSKGAMGSRSPFDRHKRKCLDVTSTVGAFPRRRRTVLESQAIVDFAKAMKEYCPGKRVARSLLLRPAFVRRVKAGLLIQSMVKKVRARGSAHSMYGEAFEQEPVCLTNARRTLQYYSAALAAFAPRHEHHRNLLARRRTAASQFFFRDPVRLASVAGN